MNIWMTVIIFLHCDQFYVPGKADILQSFQEPPGTPPFIDLLKLQPKFKARTPLHAINPLDSPKYLPARRFDYHANNLEYTDRFKRSHLSTNGNKSQNNEDLGAGINFLSIGNDGIEIYQHNFNGKEPIADTKDAESRVFVTKVIPPSSHMHLSDIINSISKQDLLEGFGKQLQNVNKSVHDKLLNRMDSIQKNISPKDNQDSKSNLSRIGDQIPEPGFQYATAQRSLAELPFSPIIYNPEGVNLPQIVINSFPKNNSKKFKINSLRTKNELIYRLNFNDDIRNHLITDQKHIIVDPKPSIRPYIPKYPKYGKSNRVRNTVPKQTFSLVSANDHFNNFEKEIFKSDLLRESAQLIKDGTWMKSRKKSNQSKLIRPDSKPKHPKASLPSHSKVIHTKYVNNSFEQYIPKIKAMYNPDMNLITKSNEKYGKDKKVRQGYNFEESNLSLRTKPFGVDSFKQFSPYHVGDYYKHLMSEKHLRDGHTKHIAPKFKYIHPDSHRYAKGSHEHLPHEKYHHKENDYDIPDKHNAKTSKGHKKILDDKYIHHDYHDHHHHFDKDSHHHHHHQKTKVHRDHPHLKDIHDEYYIKAKKRISGKFGHFDNHDLLNHLKLNDHEHNLYGKSPHDILHILNDPHNRYFKGKDHHDHHDFKSKPHHHPYKGNNHKDYDIHHHHKIEHHRKSKYHLDDHHDYRKSKYHPDPHKEKDYHDHHKGIDHLDHKSNYNSAHHHLLKDTHNKHPRLKSKYVYEEYIKAKNHIADKFLHYGNLDVLPPIKLNHHDHHTIYDVADHHHKLKPHDSHHYLAKDRHHHPPKTYHGSHLKEKGHSFKGKDHHDHSQYHKVKDHQDHPLSQIKHHPHKTKDHPLSKIKHHPHKAKDHHHSKIKHHPHKAKDHHHSKIKHHPHKAKDNHPSKIKHHPQNGKAHHPHHHSIEEFFDIKKFPFSQPLFGEDLLGHFGNPNPSPKIPSLKKHRNEQGHHHGEKRGPFFSAPHGAPTPFHFLTEDVISFPKYGYDIDHHFKDFPAFGYFQRKIHHDK